MSLHCFQLRVFCLLTSFDNDRNSDFPFPLLYHNDLGPPSTVGPLPRWTVFDINTSLHMSVHSRVSSFLVPSSWGRRGGRLGNQRKTMEETDLGQPSITRFLEPTPPGIYSCKVPYLGSSPFTSYLEST